MQSQVADLAARVASNLRNSSKPSSWDGLAKPAPKSLRGKSGRKPGRPKGQMGATMQLSKHPDKTSATPAGAVRLLREVPEARGRHRGRAPPGHRHPLVKAVTIEHQMLTLVYYCGHETKAAAPDG